MIQLATDLTWQSAPIALLDVAVLSLLLYGLISILRRSITTPVLIAGGVLLGLYALARTLNLYVTESVMRASFLIALVVLVVAFQTDIRRCIHQLGTWRNGARRPTDRDSRLVDMLLETVTHLAKEKTGALIAIRGREDWQQHVEGGTDLEGQVSAPLLHSIFSTDTPGHDGAVLLEGGRLTRFGVHLPLSVNLIEVGEHGTRHTAALGLSEHCDAFVIVVSEESGRVSVAQDRQLTPTTPSQLRTLLEQFWMEYYHQPKRGLWRWTAQPAVQNAAIAIGLASLLWLQLGYHEKIVSQSYTIPIRLQNLDPAWWLLDPVPTKVLATVGGPEELVQNLKEDKLVVELDLGRLEAGRNEFTVAPDNLELPNRIEIQQIDPQPVVVLAEPTKEALIPVRVVTSGQLPPSLTLISTAADPQSILLQFPSSGHPPPVVSTEPIDLAKLSVSSEVETRIVLPERSRLPAERTGKVTVKIELAGTKQAPPKSPP